MLRGGQNVKVRDVDENINSYHQQRAEDESYGHIPLRILDLTGHHAQVVPAVVSPQRSNRGGAEGGEKARLRSELYGRPEVLK